MASYSGTPLLKKLGITPERRVFIWEPVETLLTELQKEALPWESKLTGEFDYLHLFCKTQLELRQQFPQLLPHLSKKGMLWVSWPKLGKLQTDLNENIIRELSLLHGLVDVKVVAVDETWSALKFVYRLKDRERS
jgi:hypothetical protein